MNIKMRADALLGSKPATIEYSSIKYNAILMISDKDIQFRLSYNHKSNVLFLNVNEEINKRFLNAVESSYKVVNIDNIAQFSRCEDNDVVIIPAVSYKKEIIEKLVGKLKLVIIITTDIHGYEDCSIEFYKSKIYNGLYVCDFGDYNT